MKEDDRTAAVSYADDQRKQLALGIAIFAHLAAVLIVNALVILWLRQARSSVFANTKFAELILFGWMMGICSIAPLNIAFGRKNLLLRLLIALIILFGFVSISGFWFSPRRTWLPILCQIHIMLFEVVALFYGFRVAGLQLYRETIPADKPSTTGLSIAALLELTFVVAVIFGLQRYLGATGQRMPWQLHLVIPAVALNAALPCSLWLFGFKSVLRRFFLVYGVMAVLTAIGLTTAAYSPKLTNGNVSSSVVMQHFVLMFNMCSVLSIFMLILRINRYRLRWSWY